MLEEEQVEEREEEEKKDFMEIDGLRIQLPQSHMFSGRTRRESKQGHRYNHDGEGRTPPPPSPDEHEAVEADFPTSPRPLVGG